MINIKSKVKSLGLLKLQVRSYEQLKLYHAYVKQLQELDVVKIQLEDKEWRGRLGGLKTPRYLLKALDLELPKTNKAFPDKSPNKNEFCDVDSKDLTHHISWLREVLWDNGVVPYNDKGLYC